MDVETKIFLRKRFASFYAKNPVDPPSEIEKREFGFGTLTDKIKVRHKSFNTGRDLRLFLRRDAPFYISYSVAFYDYPENPMREKGWRGAELVFDLDVDMDYLDTAKLTRVKHETLNLIDFITDDFGIPADDIRINFSGGKGYHIHVLSESVKDLGRDERREIVDYLTGDVNFEDYLTDEGDSRDNWKSGPRKGDTGWRGRIFTELYEFIKDADIKKLEEVRGIGKKKAQQIIEKRGRILSELERGRYSYIPEIITFELSHKRMGDPNKRDVSIKGMKAPLIESIIQHLSVHMKAEDTDKQVTIDTSRLIRLPDSIHGGSGLIAKTVKSIGHLDDFDPLTEAVAFGTKNMSIQLSEPVPQFDLMGEKMGPFEAGVIEVPEYAGIYLLLKGKGDVQK